MGIADVVVRVIKIRLLGSVGLEHELKLKQYLLSMKLHYEKLLVALVGGKAVLVGNFVGLRGFAEVDD